MDLFNDSKEVIVLGRSGEIVKYLGSDIFKIRYRDGNITRVYSFRVKEIDFLGQDVDEFKKAFG